MHSPPSSIGTVCSCRLHYFWFCLRMNWQDKLLLTSDDPDVALRGHYTSALGIIPFNARASKLPQLSSAFLLLLILWPSSLGTISGRTGQQTTTWDVSSPLSSETSRNMSPSWTGANLMSPSCTLLLAYLPPRPIATVSHVPEWAQPSRLSNPLTPQLNHLVDAPICTQAIVPDDLRINTVAQHQATGLAILAYQPSKIAKMWVKWHTQKSNQNGKENVFARNSKLRGCCFLSSA
jgi:hypothetical protein